MHPFIDTTNLSDDQLLSKIAKCQEVVQYASGIGNHAMLSSASLALDTYRSALEERMSKKRSEEEQEKNPDGVIEIGTIEDISNKKTK